MKLWNDAADSLDTVLIALSADATDAADAADVVDVDAGAIVATALGQLSVDWRCWGMDLTQ